MLDLPVVFLLEAMSDLTSFTLFNTLQQGLGITFYIDWELHTFMLGSLETSTFQASLLHPDTEALIEKGYLRNVKPIADQIAPPQPKLSPLVWGGDWKPGVWKRGTMVRHNGVLWIANQDNSTVPSVMDQTWAPSAGAGDAAAHAARMDNPHAVTADQTGSIQTKSRGVPGGVAPLDQGGKIAASLLPDLLQIAAILETYQLRHQHNTDKGLDLGGAYEVLASEIKQHLNDRTTNPHAVTLLQLGGVASTLLGTPGGVATLNGSGKLTASQFPTMRLTDVFLVDSIAQRDALASSLGVGDTVVVKSPYGVYLWNGASFSTMTAGINVVSVNGRTGVMIELTSDDMPEGGANLYFTNDRVAASPVVAALTAKAHDRNKDSFLDYGGPTQVSSSSLYDHLRSQSNPHHVTADQAGALPKVIGFRELNGDYQVNNTDLGMCLRFVAGATITFAADLQVGFQVTVASVNGATLTLQDAGLVSRGTRLNQTMAAAFVYKPEAGILEAVGDFSA